MNIWIALAFVFAALELLAGTRLLPRLEFIAKPGLMMCLFLWLYFSTRLQGNTFWFGVGILFSLVGDVLLINGADYMFLSGLVAFLFTHIFYIAGLRDEFTAISAWSLVLLILISINAVRLLRRITGAMQAKGENRMIIPVVAYGIVISIMFYAALATIYDPKWKTSAALFVSAGALLFWTSDLILAWNKFVSPIRNGRLWNLVLYQLGQIGLIAGVISQLG